MTTIPPGYGEVVIPIKHSLLARPAMVSYGVQLNDTVDANDVNSMMDAFGFSSFIGALDTNVTIGPAECRVGQDGGEALVVSGSGTDTGEADRTDSINPSNAILIHKRTARGGRRGRGRMYIPWALDDAGINEIGVLSSGAVTALQTRCDNFLTAVNSIGVVDAMVLLHSPSAPTVENPTAEGLPNVITSITVDQVVGVQRRRLGR